MNKLSQSPNRPLAWTRALLDFCSVPDRTVSLVILLHLAVAIPLAYGLTIWLDEGFTLHTTGQSVAYAFSKAINFELQPPLYFVLLNLWRDLNDSVFFARLFSILCTALAIKAAASLAQRLWKNIHPGWMAAALALNPLLVWMATEVRVYALAILLSTLLLLFFFDGYVAENRSVRARWLYLVISVLSLYTYYYLGFILVANACALLLLRRWRPLVHYLAHMVGVALCFVPMMWIVLGQLTTHTRPVTSVMTWWAGFKHITWIIKEFILPAGETPLEPLRRWILRLVYVVTAVFLVLKPKRFLTTANIFVWTIVAVTTLFFWVMIRGTSEEMVLPRHMAVLFVPCILLAFSLIISMTGRKGIMIAVLVMPVFNVISLNTIISRIDDRNWDQVAAHIMSNEKAGQPILIFHSGSSLLLAQYYKGSNVIVPLPTENRFETFDIRGYILKDEQQIFDALARVPGEHEEVWLVSDGICEYLGVDFNCPALEEFVDKYYVVESDKRFPYPRVRLLRRKPR